MTLPTTQDEFVSYEDALLRRMLCAWNPSDGMPCIVIGKPRLHTVWQEGAQRLLSGIVGLCKCDAGDFPELAVMARDHMDAVGNVLPPMNDRGTLALIEVPSRQEKADTSTPDGRGGDR